MWASHPTIRFGKGTFQIKFLNKKAVAKMTTAFSCSFFQFLTKPAKLFHCQRFGSDGGGEVCGFDRFDDRRLRDSRACAYSV